MNKQHKTFEAILERHYRKISNTFENKVICCTKLIQSKVPRVCIETGTYRGDCTVVLSKLFDVVHTIELSDVWWSYSLKKLSNYKNVVCHKGDSAEILSKLLSLYKEPVFVFLDAHYSGGTTAFGKQAVPLLRELNVLKGRRYNDILIIDDFEMIGKSGFAGDVGGDIYPRHYFDWREITTDKITDIIVKDIRDVWWIDGTSRIIIYRNLDIFRAALLSILIKYYGIESNIFNNMKFKLAYKNYKQLNKRALKIIRRSYKSAKKKCKNVYNVSFF